MNARSPSETKAANLRTRLREATAAAILEAAEALFADKGLRATSMNDIAAGAGVAVGTLYNHFADKDALIHDLFDLRRQELLDLIDAEVKRPHPDFRAQLVAVMTAKFDYFNAHRRFYTMLWNDETQNHPAASKQAMVPVLYERLEKITRRGVKERVLKAELADYYPAMLMGLMRACGICSSVGKGKSIPTPAQIVDVFLEGATA